MMLVLTLLFFLNPFSLLCVQTAFAEQIISTDNNCETEPWGRYSASGGLYVDSNSNTYLYSFGGDTRSRGDSAGGGVVVTNFRYHVESGCWERLADGPVAIGYRATATLLQATDSLDSSFYVFGGSDTSFQAVGHFWQYSLGDDTWSEVVTTSSVAPSARWRHTAVKLSDTRMLIHGGRLGNEVLSDAWIFDVDEMEWTMISEDTGVAAHRHGMAYDTLRNSIWIFGGIDSDFVRHNRMYQWDLGSTMTNASAITEVILPDGAEQPSRRASHVLDYVAEIDSLLLYGGTCSDMGLTYLYNISSNTWCAIGANQRPSLRDAMLWGIQYPRFYMYQGDVICLRVGDVYGIADVHVLDLRGVSSSGDWEILYNDWEILYNPRNQRAPELTEFCDGSNAGACRVPPFLSGEQASGWDAVCSFNDAVTPTTTPSSGLVYSWQRVVRRTLVTILVAYAFQ